MMRVKPTDEEEMLFTWSVEHFGMLFEQSWRGNADDQLLTKPEGSNVAVVFVQNHKKLMQTSGFLNIWQVSQTEKYIEMS